MLFLLSGLVLSALTIFGTKELIDEKDIDCKQGGNCE